jgi:peptidoglycan hydrolase CwlO-like protein
MTEVAVADKPAEKAATKVVEWVVEQFVGGALKQAGGEAMNQVLSWIGLSGDDSQELNNRLDKIQEGIDELLREVKAIRAQLDDLLKQLKLSTAEIIIAINEGVIASARSSIDTHFGTAESLLAGD